MSAQTMIELPESLHERLRERSRSTGASILSLVVRALDETYAQAYEESKKGTPVTGPMLTGTGKLGPRFPVDENPHDLILS
jgi:hypothetical protein